MPATPTVSMWALRSSERPPPEPRAIPTVLKRPGASSSISTSSPASSSQAPTKRAISPSPAAPSTMSGLIESMRTSSGEQLGDGHQYGWTNSTGAPSTSMKPTRTSPKTSKGSAITFPPAMASSRLSTR